MSTRSRASRVRIWELRGDCRSSWEGASLAVALVSAVTGLDSYQAGVPVGMLITLAGFAGGYVLFRLMGATVVPALVGSAVYSVMPFTLGIQIFFGTGSGFILLPAYAAVDVVLLRWLRGLSHSRMRYWPRLLPAAAFAGYLVLRIWAIFLDGYTFVMSGLLGVGLLIATAIQNRANVRYLMASFGTFGVANVFAVGIYLHASHGVQLERGGWISSTGGAPTW